MDKYQAFFQQRLESIARKQAIVDQKAKEKKDYLDPTWNFNVNTANIRDADSVVTSTQDVLRFKNWDSYETYAQTYLERPNKFASHRRAYASAYGLDEKDVSMNDLLEAGKAQKETFKAKLLEAADPEGNISYKRRGVDQESEHRVLAEIIPEGKQAAFVQNVTSRFEDAGYTNKFNFMRDLQDFQSGDSLAHLIGAGDRSLGQATGDSVANFVRGTAEIFNDLTQAATVLTGINTKGVDKFFANNRDRLEAFKEHFNSSQQLRRERLANEKRYRITEPLYEARTQEYMTQGSTETEAKIKAGALEVADTVEGLIEQPGRILDGFFESLPYMLGVGAGGKIVLTATEKAIQKKVLDVVTKKSVAKGFYPEPQVVLAGQAQQIATRYLRSKAGTQYMKQVSEYTGVGLVGLTEGLTTAAGVYDSILGMTEEEGQNSKKYLSLRTQMNHENAVKELAEEAFTGSFGLMTLVAGIASKVTGAAAFESRIFSKLADSTKVTSLKSFAAKTGKVAQGILGPGLRETAEETIQSGAGEFLSQLAQFDATGKPIGSGIGAAAGEGAVLGFVSGAGVSGASKTGKAVFKGIVKGIKALADKKGTAKGLDEAPQINAPSLFNTTPAADLNDPEEGKFPGGSKKVILDKIKAEQAAGTYDAAVSYKTAVENYQANNKSKDIGGMIQHFNELETHYKQQEHAGQPIEEADQQYFEAVKAHYENTLGTIAGNILSQQDRTVYSPEAKGVVTEAAFRELSAVMNIETGNVSPQVGKVLSNVADINATLDTLIKDSMEMTAIEGQIAQSPKESVWKSTEEIEAGKTAAISRIAQVNASKLEDVVSVIYVRGKPKVVMGIKAHAREMIELITQGTEASKKAFQAKQGQVNNFESIQAKRLQALEQIITLAENPATSPEQLAKVQQQIGLYYVPGTETTVSPTYALKDYMVKELANIRQFQSQMAKLNNTWNSAGTVAPKTVSSTSTVTPAPKTAGQPEAAAKTPVISTTPETDIENRRQEEKSKKLNDRFSRVEEQRASLQPNQEAPLVIGSHYREGTKVEIANVVAAQTKPGEGYTIISKVIKPQINTDGVMTQAGLIETRIFDSKEAADTWVKDERVKSKSRRAVAEAKIDAKYDAELTALKDKPAPVPAGQPGKPQAQPEVAEAGTGTVDNKKSPVETPKLIDLRSESITQLKVRAKNAKLVSYSKLKKPALIALLESNDGRDKNQKYLKTNGFDPNEGAPKQPKDLLEHLASVGGKNNKGISIKLNLAEFGGDLNIEGNFRVGNSWLFEGKKSGYKRMGPRELLGWLQNNNYLPQNSDRGVNKIGEQDAVELLRSALAGERVVAFDEKTTAAQTEYDVFNEYADDVYKGEQDQQEAFAKLYAESAEKTVENKPTTVAAREAERLRISKLPLQERIPALIAAGIIEEVYQYGNRPVVVVKINGQLLPFYRSSQGTSGKEKGKWFPMFGFGKHKLTDKNLEWAIKGTLEGINSNYNSSKINEYSKIINSLLIWDHAIDSQIGFGNENPFFTPHITFKTNEEGFNKKIFGKEDLEVVLNTVSVGNHINFIVAKIDGKSPATQALKLEIADVTLIAQLLGLKGTGKTKVTAENVQKSYDAVRAAIAGGMTKENIQKIQKTLDWLDTENTPIDQDRKDRTTKRVRDGRVKPEDVNEHYALQLAEEIVEVLVELTGVTEVLTLQKAQLKVLRFGPNTIIKDGVNKGKTNIQVLSELQNKIAISVKDTYQTFTKKVLGIDVKYIPQTYSSVDTNQIKGDILPSLPGKTYHQLINFITEHSKKLENSGSYSAQSIANIKTKIARAKEYAEAMNEYTGGELAKAADPQAKETIAEEKAWINQAIEEGAVSTLFSSETLHEARSLFKSRRDTLNSTPFDPALYRALIIVGTEAIYQGAKSFALYTAHMLKEFGELWKGLDADQQEKIFDASAEQTKTHSEIYAKLGNKTKSDNVVIQSVYQQKGVTYAKSIDGVFTLRVTNFKKHFGNPFSSAQAEINKGLLPTKSIRESVEKYIDWVINSKDERANWIREQLKSGILKGKPLVYYKELGEPSHATALDYLINKYNWSAQPSATTVKDTSLEDPVVEFETQDAVLLPAAQIRLNAIKELQAQLKRQKDTKVSAPVVETPSVAPILKGENTELEASAVEANSEIYIKLGDRTKSGNVVLKSVFQKAGVVYAKSIGGVALENSEDNAVLQDRIKAGFTPEQALAQIETTVEELVAAQDEVVVEQSNYPEVVDSAKAAITNINDDKPSASTTQKMLAQLVNFGQLALQNPSLFRGFPGVKTADFDPYALRDGPLKAKAHLVQEGVIAGFDKAGMPITATDFLEQNRDETKDLHNTVRGLSYVMLRDPIARRQIYDAMEATPAEREGFDAYLEYFKEFSKTFEEIAADFNPALQQGPLKVSGTYLLSDNRLTEYSLAYLFHTLGDVNEFGKLFPDFLAMMAMESMNWISTSGPGTTFNRDDAIRRMLGFPSGYELSSAERDPFAYIGTSRLEVALRAGQLWWKHANLKVKKDILFDTFQEERIVAAMGSLMLSVMTKMDSIEGTAMSMSRFLSLTSRDSGIETTVDVEEGTTDQQKVVFIKNSPISDSERDKGSNSVANEELGTAWEKAKRIFAKYFNSASIGRGPVFEMPTKDDISNEVSRGLMRIPKLLLERILYMSQRQLRVSKRIMEGGVNRFDHERFLTLILGQASEDKIKNWTHEEDRKSLRSKNLKNKGSLNSIKNFFEKHKDNIFYTLYKVIVTGRIYTDSNTVDIQNDPVHRFFVQMEEWKNELDTTDTSSEQYFMFMVAIGLGFDVDPSLWTQQPTSFDLLRNTYEQEVKRKIDHPDVQAALAIFRKEGTGAFSPTEEEIIGKAVDYMGVNSHSFVVLQEYAAYLNAKAAGEKFTTYLPTEVDGKNNGLIAMLLQFVPTDAADLEQSKKMLNAGSVFFQGDEFKNNPDYKAAGKQDNYEGLSSLLGTYLEQMINRQVPPVDTPSRLSETSTTERRKQWIRENGVGAVVKSNLLPTIRQLELEDIEAGEKKGKKGRNLAKPTLMRVSYLAMIKSIKKGQINDALVTFREMLATVNLNGSLTEAQHAEAIANVIQMLYGIINVTRNANYATEYRNRDKETGLWESADTDSLNITAKDVLALAKQHDATDIFAGLKKVQLTFSPEANEIKDFGIAMQETYGHATEAALDKMLRGIRKIQTTMIQATQWMNIAFTKDFGRRLKHFELVMGTQPNRKERETILNQMIREGAILGIDTPLTKNVLERLDITKRGQIILKEPALDAEGNPELDRKGKPKFKNIRGIAYTGKKIRNYQALPQSAEDKAAKKDPDTGEHYSIQTSIKGYSPDANIGVSAIVKAIHATDGAVNSGTFGKFPSINVHDAIITGIQYTLEAAQTSNQSFGDYHAEYSIVQAIWDSFVQMQSLVDGVNSKLSERDKGEIVAEFYENMVKFSDWTEGVSHAQKVKRIKEWVVEVQTTVVNNTAARKKLFADTRYIGQFSIDGGEVRFANGLSTKDPKANVTTVINSQEELFDKLLPTSPHKELYTDVVQALAKTTDPTEIILNYLFKLGSPQNAKDIFDMVVSAYSFSNSPAARVLREIKSMVDNNLEGVTIQTLHLPLNAHTGKQDSAHYDPATKVITLDTIDPNNKTRNATQDIAHEVLHAMNYTKLQVMEATETAKFAELVNQVKDFIVKLDKTNSTNQKIVHAIMFDWATDKASVVSEYMSHVLTQPKDIGANYEHFFRGQEIKAAIQTLNTSLAGQSDLAPYRNAGGDLDINSFEARYADLLESDKLQLILQDLEALHGAPTDAQENAFLDAVAEGIAIPGLRSIEPLMINIATVDAGTMHEGAFYPPTIDAQGNAVTGTIYVAAAGNPTTSMTTMSPKEVTLHEIVHAIIEAVINVKGEGSWALRQEGKRLFDLAKKHVTPEHFLRDPASASSYDKAAAQARWDHIFNNPTAQGYHEFLAMTATNFQFAKILSSITNKAIKSPIADWNLLTLVTNLLKRIVDWLQGYTTRKNTPDVHSAVMNLVQNIIKINNQNIAGVSQLKQESFVNRWNDKTVKLIAEKLLKKLQSTKLQEEVLDASRAGEHTNLIKLAGAVVSSATSVNTQEFRDALGEYYRTMRWKKDNALFQLLEEVLPYQQANIKFMDLLRKSKVLIDINRQRMIEHTRSALLRKFDPDAFRSQEQRNAVTQALLMTDMSALTQGNNPYTTADIISFMEDRDVAQMHLNSLKSKLEAALLEQLPAAQASRLFRQFVNVQGWGLAKLMVEKIAPIPMQMENAHNIVNQFYIIDESKQLELTNKESLIDTLDKIISMQALLRTERVIINSALKVIQHEMARNLSTPEDAITYLLGDAESFKEQSKIVNFENNPVFMKKGYIQEIYDEDIEVKIVPASLSNPASLGNDAKMLAEGWKVAEKTLGRYQHDPNRVVMSLWTRRSTITGFQKAIFSLTDIKQAGTNIFTSLEQALQDPNSDGRISAFKAGAHFQSIKQSVGNAAAVQTAVDPLSNNIHMVPILDDSGKVKDFVYVMSEKHRRVHLKKRSYFDEVLPAMYGAMLDKRESKFMNRETVEALYNDWREYGEYEGHPKHPAHRFVEISKHSKNAKARELYRLLPKDTQEHIKEFFGGNHFYIRDDLINLVMGVRELTIANKEFLGKAAPVVRLLEKIFQELMQWKRIQIAILNPMVVMGNIISNILILLIEGIPPSYIMKMGLEALQGIRQYQKDIRTADELEHEVFSARKMGFNVQDRVNKLSQLQDNIRRNPVGKLIDAGLFTSMIEEFGVDENSWKNQKISKLTDAVGEKMPKRLIGGIKEVWMLPGSKAFQAALVGTQYSDFVARYIKYNYDTKVLNQDMPANRREAQAINDSLATFIYYDLPQNEYLQYANNMGFLMFTKFFLRIQPVLAKMFLKNPLSASMYMGLQSMITTAPFNENIYNFAGLSGVTNKFTWNPLEHVIDPEYVTPASFLWLDIFGISAN